MAQRGSEFPIGKVLSFLVVLALTVLPVVSCGPIDFKGHEILRNEPPSVDGLDAEIERSLGSLGGGTKNRTDDAGQASAGVGKSKRDTLFPPGETWMWLLYIAVFGAGVVSFFVPSGHRARMALGLFGAVGLLVFLTRFQDALGGSGDAPSSDLTLIKWDAGAYIALVAFALILFDGLRAPSGAGRVLD
jgi:hypothetical protein